MQVTSPVVLLDARPCRSVRACVSPRPGDKDNRRRRAHARRGGKSFCGQSRGEKGHRCREEEWNGAGLSGVEERAEKERRLTEWRKERRRETQRRRGADL